jgi:hypothetical protein
MYKLNLFQLYHEEEEEWEWEWAVHLSVWNKTGL